MADSITDFDLYRKTTAFTTSPPAVEGTLIQQLPGSARSFTDGTLPSPDFFYRLIGHTASGLVIPYNDIAAHGQTGTPGGTLFASALTGRSNDQSRVLASAVASDGSFYTAGYMQGVINFGGTSVTNTSAAINGFVAKWSSAGQLIWVNAFSPGNYRGIITGVSVSSSGQIVIAGTYSAGTINFGGGFTLTNPTITTHSFVAGLNATTGVGQMAHEFLALDSSNADTATSLAAMATDATGNILVSGNYSGTINFGGGITVSGNFSYLAKLSSAGIGIWGVGFGIGGTTPAAIVPSLYPSVDGSFYIGGTFTAPSLNFGNNIIMNNTGDRDGFLVKYSSSGSALFGRQFGSANGGAQYLYGLSQDLDGNILACGTFTNSINTGAPSPLGAGAFNTLWMGKYTATLGYIWSFAFGGDQGDSAFAVTTDSNKNVYITGDNKSPMNFGNNVWSFGNGVPNVFITKFTQDGLAQWTRRFITNAAFNDGFSIASSPPKPGSTTAVWASGFFGGAIDFGNNFTFTSTPSFSDAGFLLKLNP